MNTLYKVATLVFKGSACLFLNFQSFWVLLGPSATQVLSVPLKNRPLAVGTKTASKVAAWKHEIRSIAPHILNSERLHFRNRKLVLHFSFLGCPGVSAPTPSSGEKCEGIIRKIKQAVLKCFFALQTFLLFIENNLKLQSYRLIL